MIIATDLVNDINHRQIILFLGAGISVSTKDHIGFPSGWELASLMSNKFLSRDVKECESLAEIGQQIVWSHGGSRASLQDYLKGIFENPKVKPNNAHYMLTKLHLPMVTTNYDRLIENAFAIKQIELSTTIGETDLLKNRGDQLFKIHGCISNPESCIITESDYYFWMNNDSQVKDLLKAWFVMNHVVFIGYSVSDINFRSLLLELKRKYGQSIRRSHIVAPRFGKDSYAYNFALKEIGAGFIESTAEDFLSTLVEMYGSEYEFYKSKYKDEYFNESDNINCSFIRYAANKLLDEILCNKARAVELDDDLRDMIFEIACEKTDKIYHSESWPKPPDGMVYVPPGEFIQGGARQGNEKIRVAKINKGFFIDETLVTNAEYRKFLDYIDKHGDDNFCHLEQPKYKSHYPNSDFTGSSANDILFKPVPSDYFTNSIYDDFPVVNIDWWDAYAYSMWIGKRLPYEVEWEKAARGIDGRIYPYGNAFSKAKCNVADSGIGLPTKVNTYPDGRSPYGCYDMSGNVWEWCQDSFSSEGEGKINTRVVKGGSYSRGEEKARADFRNGRYVGDRWITRGFRCVKDLPEHKL